VHIIEKIYRHFCTVCHQAIISVASLSFYMQEVHTRTRVNDYGGSILFALLVFSKYAYMYKSSIWHYFSLYNIHRNNLDSVHVTKNRKFLCIFK